MMEENTYDHIKDYLEGRIGDPNSPEVRNLIGDFAILWNQYERAIYEGEHHIWKIKEAINQYHLEELDNIDILYDRYKRYIESRKHKFTSDEIKEMFNIKIKKEEPRRRYYEG